MKKILGFFLLICGIVFMGLDIYVEFQGGESVTMRSRLVLAIILLMLLISSYRILGREFPAKKYKYFQIIIWLFFVYYLCILFTLLFFSYGMGRNLIRHGLNIHPLFTIRNYYLTYENGHMPRDIFIINMIGNVVAFAPMGFFGPVLFQKFTSFWAFFWRMGVLIALIEIIQLITYTGSCDIDDWILNMCGAVLVYLWMQLPYFNKIRLQEDNKDDQKNSGMRLRIDGWLHGQNH